MKMLALLCLIPLLAGCFHNVRPECSAATEPVVITKTEVRYVRINDELTKKVERDGPAIPNPDGPTTCGMALKAAKAGDAALSTCNSRLQEIGTVEGTEKNDG